MRRKKLVFAIVIIVIFTFIFIAFKACKKDEAAEAAKKQTARSIVTAQLKKTSTNLYYSGTIQPAHIDRVTSPADGVAEKLFFRYGEVVQKGQLLMIISSTKIQDDYRSALTDYLKAKDDYLKNKANFEATSLLYKAEIVPRDEYENDKSSLQSSELTLVSATDNLMSAANKLPGGMDFDFTKLTLQQIDQVKKLLEKKYDKLNIYATATGIALYSDKSSGDSDSSKILQSGSEVKENQVVVSIGHLTGISTTVYVGELDINKLKPGQAVTITSPALPNFTFNGKVVEVGAQAKSASGGDSGGGAVTFPVSILVPTITDEQRKLVKIGMDAKVQIIIENPAQIILPLDAVFDKEGVSTVTVLDPKTNQTHDVPVVTGATDESTVTILSGIKPGDKVVLP